MIKSLILVLTLVSIVITNPVYDPKFPNLGLDLTGKPFYGRITILTGLAYPDGIHFNAPYETTKSVKDCADHVIKNEHNGMASWTRKTKRCTLIYSDKTVEGDEFRKYSRMVIRAQVLGGGVHESNAEIKYIPKGQKSWTATKTEVEGGKKFNEFMDKCDVGLESWVKVHNVSQWGWSCLTYVKDDTSVLLFVNKK